MAQVPVILPATWAMINTDSELFSVVRANGILTALIVPRTAGGLISGVSSLPHLDG